LRRLPKTPRARTAASPSVYPTTIWPVSSEKGAEQDIPYQSPISGLIHQFVEGQLATRSDTERHAASTRRGPDVP
jgi:hypothetical protein